MRVILAADHRGFALKEELKRHVQDAGYAVEDVGAHALDQNDDYPDLAFAGAVKVAESPENRGIFICGSGMGMDVAANKVRGVRATVVSSEDAARHARTNDDITVATLPADLLSLEQAKGIAAAFLMTPFSREERYARRVEKIKRYENSSLR